LINPPRATATNCSHPEIPAPRPPLLWISFRPLSTSQPASSIIRIYIHQQQWHPYYVNSHGSLLPSLDPPLLPLRYPYRVDSLLPLFEKLEVDHLNCWVLVPSLERFLPSKSSRTSPVGELRYLVEGAVRRDLIFAQDWNGQQT